jgi:2,3-bisphosphoglycerate-independent phosphoglycerate mutase
MSRLIFIFLDGVGIGRQVPGNPFYLAKAPYLPLYNRKNNLPDQTPIKAIDPILGIPGFPQSATGQTTLYTGKPVPVLLKRHQGTTPTKLMRQIIREHNLISTLKNNRIKATFINAYPVFARYFSTPHVNIKEDGRLVFSSEFPELFKRRISVTSCMMISSRITPFDEHDILAEKSVYQDYSNIELSRRGLTLPEFTPEKAAEIIFRQSRHYDFMLYEYFQTDIYAHRKSISECTELIKNMSRLIEKLVNQLDKRTDTLLITSDHGNLEDCSIRSHTLNPVPLIVWGKGSKRLRDSISTIADVTPAITRFFSIPV